MTPGHLEAVAMREARRRTAVGEGWHETLTSLAGLFPESLTGEASPDDETREAMRVDNCATLRRAVPELLLRELAAVYEHFFRSGWWDPAAPGRLRYMTLEGAMARTLRAFLDLPAVASAAAALGYAGEVRANVIPLAQHHTVGDWHSHGPVAIFPLDTFAAATGATLVVRGANTPWWPMEQAGIRRPDREHVSPLEGEAGSALLLARNLWHARGATPPHVARRALAVEFAPPGVRFTWDD